jgi:superfamily I DNA and/or RNA helicase
MARKKGTVDKFQGQEAPVCLISMATSSADALPRNIEFLFSVNRLNVAISRGGYYSECNKRLKG